MEVTVAKTAGFCFGVKRAVEKVYDQIGRTEKRIYTYGPIIHNEQVVGDLREKGVEVIDSLEELKTIRNAVVVIRSHGVGKNVYEILKENGVEIVDATCPYVKKIHRIVEKQSAEGRKVLIIGSEDHPEVQGIKGWVGVGAHLLFQDNQLLRTGGQHYNHTVARLMKSLHDRQ